MCVLCVPVYEYEHACTMIYIWKSEDNFRCWFISSPYTNYGDSLSVSHSHHMSAVIDVCFYGEGRRRRRKRKRRRRERVVAFVILFCFAVLFPHLFCLLILWLNRYFQKPPQMLFKEHMR